MILSPFAHLCDPDPWAPISSAGSVLHPDPAEQSAPVHLPTAFLPDDDPANGEQCRECGEWWPCTSVMEDAAWRGHSHGSERKCDTTCWSEPLDKALNPDGERCAQCGRVARGSAFIDGKRYCHGDKERPSCYEREQWAGQGDRALDLLPARFIVAPDAWETPTIWSGDPDHPAKLLARHQLGTGPAADALWLLIVGAVEGGQR